MPSRISLFLRGWAGGARWTGVWPDLMRCTTTRLLQNLACFLTRCLLAHLVQFSLRKLSTCMTGGAAFADRLKCQDSLRGAVNQ